MKTLGSMGYRMILFPLTAFRVAMKAAEDTFRDLFERGTQASSLAKMMTRPELYDLLGYTGYEAGRTAYFGGGGGRSSRYQKPTEVQTGLPNP